MVSVGLPNMTGAHVSLGVMTQRLTESVTPMLELLPDVINDLLNPKLTVSL